MFIRTVSSIVGLPFLIGLIVYGGVPLKLALLAVALIGMQEFYSALLINKKAIVIPAYIAAGCYVFFIDIVTASGIIFIISLFMLAIMAIQVIYHQTIDIRDGAGTVFGFIYICMLLSNVYLIRHYRDIGIYVVWIVFIAAWGCDTGAYLTGSAIGKRKLIPELSPNKTVEGSVGGVVLATVLSLIYGIVVSILFEAFAGNIVIASIIIGFFGSIFCQFGDLFASSVKRYTGIKDYGKLIPGHGGVLDRFDSVIVTAPVVYCLLLILARFL